MLLQALRRNRDLLLFTVPAAQALACERALVRARHNAGS
jgi:hypothetical protein